jgi:hypothetical protein
MILYSYSVKLSSMNFVLILSKKFSRTFVPCDHHLQNISNKPILLGSNLFIIKVYTNQIHYFKDTIVMKL